MYKLNSFGRNIMRFFFIAISLFLHFYKLLILYYKKILLINQVYIILFN